MKTWGNGSAGVLVPGRHGPGIRGSFLNVTVGIANLNEMNGDVRRGIIIEIKIPTNFGLCN